MADLALIVPTRGRPQNITRLVGAWDFTNAWDVADLWLAVDADDPELEGYRAIERDTRHPDTDEPLIRLMVFPIWMPMVHKLNSAALALADGGEYFALGFAGDDHVPQTIGWAKTYLAELKKLGTGMVYGDDGYQGRKLSTEWAVTTDAVVALGRMVPAPVEHMYCDNAIMELFEAAGALVHLPQVRIEHLHPIVGKAESDAQYERVNSRDQFKKDRAAYERWKNAVMPAQVANLKKLSPGRAAGANPRRRTKMTGRSPFPRHFKQVKGLTPEEVGLALADFASEVPRDQVIVELGVYHGKTALWMAWAASQLNGVGNGPHVWAIDPWELEGNVYTRDEGWGDMSGARSWARYWVQSLGYTNAISLVHAFSRDVAAGWTGPKVGLLFVDGDHTYEGARGDIEAWAPHLGEGARIAIDDYVSPDFPGVKAAVDALVTEGVLAPIELYHDRLAVTRLATGEPSVKAITGEGVSPPPVVEDYHPYPAAPGQVADSQVADRETLEAEWERVDPEGVAALRESAAKLDAEVSKRLVVVDGELEGVAAGTSIDALTIPEMKELARKRGITLGSRKDKKILIRQALEEGR